MRDPAGAEFVVLPGTGPAAVVDQTLAGLLAVEHVRAVAARLGSGPSGANGRYTIVLAGDAPLLTAESVDHLVRRHTAGGAAVTLLRAAPDPGPSAGGDWLEEHCRAEALRDDRSVVACVLGPEPARVLLAEPGVAAPGDASANGHGTGPADPMARVLDVVQAAGWAVGEAVVVDWRDTVRVVDAVSLAYATRVLRDRIVRRCMLSGAFVTDPDTIWIDATAVVEPGAFVGPRTRLAGATTVAAGARVGPDVSLVDTSVGAGAQVRYAVCDGAEIGPDVQVGPYTYLRRGTRLGPGSGAGCFVEMKGTVVGAHTMVPHFACLIDGDIGERCNIAAFSGLANFDGVSKRRAVIGDDVLVASGTAVLAPAKLGDGSVTAAGTVVTKDVPPGALAIARVSQVNVDGWVESRMPDSRSARSARLANTTNGKQVT